MNLQNYSDEKDSTTDISIFVLFIVLFITRRYHLMLPADGNIDWIAIQRKPRRSDEMSWRKLLRTKKRYKTISPLHLLFTVIWHRLVLFYSYDFAVFYENSPLFYLLIVDKLSKYSE